MAETVAEIKTGAIIVSGQDVASGETNACAASASAGVGASLSHKKPVGCSEGEEGGGGGLVKKRKTRRGKPKRRNNLNNHSYEPYVKPSWVRDGKPAKNGFKERSKLMHSVTLAPYNTTQFLIEDHGDLKELDHKLEELDAASTSLHPRTRDSSFSVDSDVDFYSSPEDEEQFLTKEFDNAYEDLHAERLQQMSKNDLIKEYLQLESKFESLNKKLKSKSRSSTAPCDESTLQQYQDKITRLTEENDRLRKQLDDMRNRKTCSSGSSSIDSESDSSSSTCDSSDSDSENHVDHCQMNGSSPSHASAHKQGQR